MRVVHVADVLSLVTAAGKVNAGREGGVGVGLGVLTVAPHNLEVFRNLVIIESLVARLGDLVVKLEETRVFVSLDVVTLRIEGPGAFGKDIPPQLEVHLVADSKVVTTIGQTEATVGVIHVSGHQETTLIAAAEGEEKEGYSNG